MAETRGRGRPTKITPELIDEAERLILEGAYASVASAIVGICTVTWYDWIKRGEDPMEKNPLYMNFSERIQRAGAIAEHDAMWNVRRHAREDMPGDWRGDMEFLKRRFNSRWGDRVHQDQRIDATVRTESPRERLRAKLDQMAQARQEGTDGDSTLDGPQEPDS
ncbi:MAG: hypothetical protein RQ723_13220 [Desulfuromonadales bacterium]|nr:hypothetical protein [Desulfuromonadales bacterium]